jgi:hypothetical protein
MASPTLYATKLGSANQAITQLEAGTPSVVLDGVTYTAADLPAAYAKRILALRADGHEGGRVERQQYARPTP